MIDLVTLHNIYSVQEKLFRALKFPWKKIEANENGLFGNSQHKMSTQFLLLQSASVQFRPVLREFTLK